ncbi:VOC family protein [Lactococcus ileimucosae]|uniref:VOC family protein n=1 Tax=Lactococcus ileimucosae TaxID=2941329 RepID=A0ABV4D4Q0_9LACT
MSLNAYLNFQGNGREALDFYSEVFNTKPSRIETFGDMPASPEYPLPEEIKEHIAFSELEIMGGKFMISDVFPNMPFTQGNNYSLLIQDKNPEVLKEIFHKLSKGGKVEMELQETFWSKCYGSLTDKFGVIWQVGAEEG